MKQVTSKDDVLTLIQNALPEDFDYDSETDRYVYTNDLCLCLESESFDVWEDRRFDESWVRKFPDPVAYRRSVHIYYDGNFVQTVYCAAVDGGRYLVPYPKNPAELTITPFEYKLSRILNFPFPGYTIDQVLVFAGIIFQEEDGL